MPITTLKASRVQAFLAHQESLALATYNRRLAALRSFTRWLCGQRWLADALLKGVERKPEEYRIARVLVRALTLLIHGRGDRLREMFFSRTEPFGPSSLLLFHTFQRTAYHPRSFQNACSSCLQAVSCPINAKNCSLSSCGTIGSSGMEKVSITVLSASILKTSIIGSSP